MPAKPARSYFICILGILLLLLSAVSAFAQEPQGVQEDISVAVMPFSINASEDLQYLEESFPELLGERLREAGFQVPEQDRVRNLLAENPGLEGVDGARELALLAGTGFAVYGDFSQFGETFVIDAKVIDAFGDKKPVSIQVQKSGVLNLLPAVDELVNRMRSSLLRQDVVAEIEVRGNKILDKEVVLMRLPIREGDILTASVVNKSLKSIYDLGYFDDVKVILDDLPEGKKVIFQVREKPRVDSIAVRGDDDMTEEILEAVVTKKGAVVNPKVLAQDMKTIRDMYRKEGYYKAKITHELQGGDEGLARLTFVIDPGPELYVEEIVIDGAKQVDPDDVKDVLVLQERGLLSLFTNSGVLREDMLERDAAAIMAFYSNHGFLQAKVGKPDIEVMDDGLRIVYRVWEGPRFKMGETRFKGDLIDTPEKLKTIVGVDDLAAEEEWFNRSLIREDIQKLTDYYNNYGYAHADVEVHLEDFPDAGLVNVEYTVVKHQRVHVRRVLIEGNTTTRDNVILREMRLADGDMYSGKKINRSTQRLNNLGYFETVDVSPVPTGNPDEMDLLVKVKDAPTGNIGGGIGYSSYDGVFLAGKISERNLFGKGYQLSFSGSFGARNTAYNLKFVNPYLYDTDVGMSINAHRNTTDKDEYKIDSTGAGLAFFYPIGEYTNLNWKYNAAYYDIYDLSDDASDDTKDDEGSHLVSSFTGTFNRSTVNSRRFPSDGSKLTASVTVGGGPLAGTDHFIKEQGTYEYYTELYEDLVFHGKGKIGFLHDNILNDDDLPTNQRFKLGGMGSVRGYSNYKITALEDNGDTIGGNKELFTNLELLYLLSEEYGIQLVSFLDAGNVWKEGEMFFEQVERIEEAPSLGLYKSVGVGFRWLSPMGPIRVEFGHGLDELHDSGNNKVEFMMGQNF